MYVLRLKPLALAIDSRIYQFDSIEDLLKETNARAEATGLLNWLLPKAHAQWGWAALGAGVAATVIGVIHHFTKDDPPPPPPPPTSLNIQVTRVNDPPPSPPMTDAERKTRDANIAKQNAQQDKDELNRKAKGLSEDFPKGALCKSADNKALNDGLSVSYRTEKNQLITVIKTPTQPTWLEVRKNLATRESLYSACDQKVARRTAATNRLIPTNF